MRRKGLPHRRTGLYTVKNKMNESWESIYTTPLPHRAELAKALLLEHDIPAVVVNKQSSSYPTIGWGKSEVHVPVDQAILAKVILENEATFS
jgi:hypothetical protein